MSSSQILINYKWKKRDFTGEKPGRHFLLNDKVSITSNGTNGNLAAAMRRQPHLCGVRKKILSLTMRKPLSDPN